MDSRAPLKTCGHKLRGMTERREQWDALLDQSRVSASDEKNKQRRYPTDSQWDSGETLNAVTASCQSESTSPHVQRSY